MQYLSNVLPRDPSMWSKNNTLMTNSKIDIKAGGSVSTVLSDIDISENGLVYLPAAFKVEIEYAGDFDEFAPVTFAKLLIKAEDNYETFIAAFAQSNIENSKKLEAVLNVGIAQNVSSFEDMIFTIYSDVPVVITSWKMFPVIDLNSGTIAAIESMLPVFLYSINDKVLEIKQADIQISEIIWVQGMKYHLSNHLLINYDASEDCIATIMIYLDGTPEPYCPLYVELKKGRGIIGIPHSFLFVTVAKHTMQTLMHVDKGTVTVQAKGIRHSVEGRGIIDTGGMELPHAEIIDNFRYPDFRISGFNVVDEVVSIEVQEPHNRKLIDEIPYPAIDASGFRVSSAFVLPRSGSVWSLNFNIADNVTVEGTGLVSSAGTSIGYNDNYGETIVKYNTPLPLNDNTIINIAEPIVTTASLLPGIVTIAYSNDGENWFCIGEDYAFHEIDLEYEAMRTSGSTIYRTEMVTFEEWHRLLSPTNNLYFAVYMQAEFASEAMTLKSIQVYTMHKED